MDLSAEGTGCDNHRQRTNLRYPQHRLKKKPFS
jgi:hypothetical protein